VEFTPLAFESLGVRSMCSLVETPDAAILFDAGASLGPRFGLLPHPQEYRALSACRDAVRRAAGKAQVVTVSHYHYDHFSPTFRSDTVWTWSSLEEALKIYSGKTLLLKDIRESINYSQRRRGWMFRSVIEKHAEKVVDCDGRVIKMGRTRLSFSRPIPHGELGAELGYVLALTVEHRGDRVTIAPDVQGPVSHETLTYLAAAKSRLTVVGGPPTYLASLRPTGVLERGLSNLAKLAAKTPTLVVDHHLLRDEEWREQAGAAFKAAAKKGNALVTAAEYIGREPQTLEAVRRSLYEEQPPSKEFVKWTKLSPKVRRTRMPPL